MRSIEGLTFPERGELVDISLVDVVRIIGSPM